MAPPAKRSRTAASTAASQQSRLSFRSTKDGAAPASSLKKQRSAAPAATADIEPTQPSTAVPEEAATSPSLETTTDVDPATADIDPATINLDPDTSDSPSAAPAPNPDDARARAVSSREISAYWAAKERARKAPRVHQGGLSERAKILREFDMTGRFGPSIGIARSARWRRAQALGLAPPLEVLAVLLREEDEARAGTGTAAAGQKGALGRAKPHTAAAAAVGGEYETSVLDELLLSSRGRGDVGAETVLAGM